MNNKNRNRKKCLRVKKELGKAHLCLLINKHFFHHTEINSMIKITSLVRRCRNHLKVLMVHLKHQMK